MSEDAKEELAIKIMEKFKTIDESIKALKEDLERYHSKAKRALLELGVER